MKKIMYVLILVLTANLMACAQEDGNVDVSITSSTLPLIPATAVSCLAQRNAGSDAATPDVSASYFKIPVITFTRKDTSKTLIIAFIRVSIQIPGSASPVTCEYGGDQLAALRTEWFNNATKEAAIPVGEASYATGCAMYCGGINSTNQFVATGTLEVFGLERDDSQNETPVKVQTTITIQSY
ncbi:MAG: hypothetical protein OM95_00840 [Bdellovibrio sp. ArHS]|uniref:hypothetical protein n=1 Tax=Bdellovibrio sp. ArHS TaxID=1569284 RepID=UPI000583BFDF|nr:hypothetical protein [Bdellovibrio sp. ArHS]KHD89950.1 MAG: hypothetical protein OM95_00840 [Bdellovibrio sp. ArHS]